MLREDNNVYICKNDIDKYYSFLAKHGFGGFNKAYLKREFDTYIQCYRHDKICLTGSKFDKKRQRHTQFVDLYKFYNFVVKGLDK